MKKQLKYILITLAAAAVVGLCALAAVLFIPDAPADTSSTLVSQKVQIYEKTSADVVKMTVTNQHGSYDILPKPSGNFYIDGLEKYTGDSFRDLTRIAKINDKMWSELFLLNRAPL